MPTRWRAITWINADPSHWRIYTALGGDELIHCNLKMPSGNTDQCGLDKTQKHRSTLAQVMACCLTAPSHYQNKCWLIINHQITISQNIPQQAQPSIAQIILKVNYPKLHSNLQETSELTHWGQVTHICVNKQSISGSDSGLSTGWRQAIIWTNAETLLIGPLGTNFSEILIKIYTLSFKKMHLKMSSENWRPFCLSLNVLKCM